MGIAVTGEVIKSALSLKILETFPTIPVYKEKIPQGFITPSFFINALDTSQEEVGKNIYEQTYLMNVRYVPQDGLSNTYEVLSGIGNTLMDILSSIDVDIYLGSYVEGLPVLGKKQVLGELLSYKNQDEVLQFFGTYTIRVKRASTDTINYMDSLEINQ